MARSPARWTDVDEAIESAAYSARRALRARKLGQPKPSSSVPNKQVALLAENVSRLLDLNRISERRTEDGIRDPPKAAVALTGRVRRDHVGSGVVHLPCQGHGHGVCGEPKFGCCGVQPLGNASESLDDLVRFDKPFAADQGQDRAVEGSPSFGRKRELMCPQVHGLGFDEQLMDRADLVIQRLRLPGAAPVRGLSPKRDAGADERGDGAGRGYENLVRIHARKLAAVTDRPTEVDLAFDIERAVSPAAQGLLAGRPHLEDGSSLPHSAAKDLMFKGRLLLTCVCGR